MDQFLPRSEIRRRVLAATGNSTDALYDQQGTEALNLHIEDAAQQVAGASTWLSLVREVELPVGIDQVRVAFDDIETARWMTETFATSYKPGTFGTSADPFVPTGTPVIYPVKRVLAVSVWDEERVRSVELFSDANPITDSNARLLYRGGERELIDDEAGVSAEDQAENQARIADDLDAIRDMPQRFTPTVDGIMLWPPPSQRFVLRVRYELSPSWEYPGQSPGVNVDQLPSLCDGPAVAHFAAAAKLALDGDEKLAAALERRGQRRLGDLRVAHSHGGPIHLGGVALDDRAAALGVRRLVPVRP